MHPRLETLAQTLTNKMRHFLAETPVPGANEFETHQNNESKL